MTPFDASFASMRSEGPHRDAETPPLAGENDSSTPPQNAGAAHTLPTDPAEAAATRALQAAIDAYRHGSEDVGKACLSQAWELCLPAIRATIAGRVREADLRDDAEQGAFLKAWKAVRNYKLDEHGPVQNAAAFFRWFTHKAALNTVEARDKYAERDGEAGSVDDDVVRDLIEFRSERDPSEPGAEEAAIINYAELALERAGSASKGRVWQAIIIAAGEGFVDRRSIAQHVSFLIGREVTEENIRREIYNMVRALPHPRDAMNKLEVLFDWRTESPANDDATPALFNFAWQEIS